MNSQELPEKMTDFRPIIYFSSDEIKSIVRWSLSLSLIVSISFLIIRFLTQDAYRE